MAQGLAQCWSGRWSPGGCSRLTGAIPDPCVSGSPAALDEERTGASVPGLSPQSTRMNRASRGPKPKIGVRRCLGSRHTSDAHQISSLLTPGEVHFLRHNPGNSREPLGIGMRVKECAAASVMLHREENRTCSQFLRQGWSLWSSLHAASDHQSERHSLVSTGPRARVPAPPRCLATCHQQPVSNSAGWPLR